jgi:hypothetical protein
MKSLLFLSFLILSTISFAQSEKINCIIFIDGKLPQDNQIFDCYISFKDTNSIETIIEFDYIIGDLIISEKDLNSISVLNPLDDITIHFSYKNFDGRAFSYLGKIKSVLFKYSYFLLRITNLNKRKQNYYFGYSSPGGSSSFIKKEYYMFEEPH